MQIERLEKNSRRSRIVVHGDTIYLAGQVADDRTLPIREQARQAFANVDRMLATVGSDKSRILSVTIWLKSIADVKVFNEEWDAWVDQENPPARCCGEVTMAQPDILVELIVVAGR